MKKVCGLLAIGFLILCFLSSCEKANLPDDTKNEVVDGVNLILYVKPLEKLSYGPKKVKTRAAVPIGDVCKRLQLGIFQNGTKVATVSQTNDKDDFGLFTLSLAKGRYQIVVIAHNGEGGATLTSPTSIKFHKNKVTDTFYYYDELDVEDNRRQELVLKRCVAKFVLSIEDALPSALAQMEFKYTGGSSTFDAVTGMGNVHSRQTEIRAVSREMTGQPGKFEIYTFPRTDSHGLNITVTAQEAGGAVLAEKTFAEVDVKVNTISEYAGTFFGGFVDAHSPEFRLMADTVWRRQPIVRF